MWEKTRFFYKLIHWCQRMMRAQLINIEAKIQMVDKLWNNRLEDWNMRSMWAKDEGM